MGRHGLHSRTGRVTTKRVREDPHPNLYVQERPSLVPGHNVIPPIRYGRTRSRGTGPGVEGSIVLLVTPSRLVHGLKFGTVEPRAVRRQSRDPESKE